MTGSQTFAARAALGLIVEGVAVVSVLNSRLRQLARPQFDRLISSAFLLSRLGLYAAVFFLAHITPRGDIPSYYFPEASSVLRGLMPYRDFVSSYAPLHPYIDSVPVMLWHSPLSIILLSIVFDFVLLRLWLRLGRGFLQEAELRTAAILYTASAIGVQFVAVDGQDTVLIAVFLALALLMSSRARERLSGAAVGTSIAAVKFLPVLFAPAFFVVSRRPWRWALGFFVPLAAVYGTAVALHLPILVPVQQEGNVRTSGNLPYLIEVLSGITVPPRVWDVILVLVLAAIFVLLYSKARQAELEVRLRLLAFAIPAITLALMIFSKKSWPPYLMLCLFPLGALIRWTERRQVLAFALFGVVAVLENSYWATFLGLPSSSVVHQGLVQGQGSAYLILPFEFLLISGYAWLFSLALGAIRTSSATVLQGAE